MHPFKAFIVLFLPFCMGALITDYWYRHYGKGGDVEVSRVLEERAIWEKDCKAQVQKERDKCGNTPLLNRCCDSGKNWMEEEMRCQTSLEYNKRKLEECQKKVIDQAIDERGI